MASAVFFLDLKGKVILVKLSNISFADDIP
jgi:hypothetical protein